MKKIIALFFLVLLVGIVSAAPGSFVKKSNNFCTYVCLGRGGASISQCDPLKFNCSVYLGVLFQQNFMPMGSIPCDVISYIQSIFPTLLGNCGIIIPEKDVFVSSIKLSSHMTILNAGRQTVTVTIRNTNDIPAIASVKISIVKLDSVVCECNFNNEPLGKLGNATSIREFICTFRPVGDVDNPAGQNIDAIFDTLGTYKSLAVLSAILPVGTDPIVQNDFAESFFAVVKETPKPIPEIGWIVLLAIAIICLYMLGRRSHKKQRKYSKGHK